MIPASLASPSAHKHNLYKITLGFIVSISKPPPTMSLVSGEKSNFQFILRLLNTNVEGKQKVMYALTKIKGVGRRYSNLVCKKADVDLNKRYGTKFRLSNRSLDSRLTGYGQCWRTHFGRTRANRHHHPEPDAVQDSHLVPQSATRHRRRQRLPDPRQRR